MVNFGFFEDWHPAPGLLTSWSASPNARVAAYSAPAHPIPPALQQRAYLRAAWQNATEADRTARLCMISFDIPGVPDYGAMTRAVNGFLRRHDTFSSWFTFEPDGQVVRHVMNSDAIVFEPNRHGFVRDSATVRAHVQAETPGPLEWNCFTFGIIEHDDSFTVYAAVDHLHTDGLGQALTCVDLLWLYGTELSGSTVELAPTTGHLAYCEREHRCNAALDRQAAPVREWIRLLRDNGGDVPRFPLTLGPVPTGYIHGAQVTLPLFDEAVADRFEQVCARHGGRFVGGLFAAFALAEAELTGHDRYFVLTPVNTRSAPSEDASVGWYTNLVPVALRTGTAASFTELVSQAQEQADWAKTFGDVSLHRVLELTGPADGVYARPGFAATMLSYVDIRRNAGVELFDAMNGGLFGNRASSSEVYFWINRFAHETTFSALFPDTPDAHESVGQYIAAVRTVFAAVVTEGDFAIRIGAPS
ncbi:condensation domain-containing protein [Nocardia stercoris]|uniref:Acyltransferase n=1 Tax=Nocardia stercoris TaxID=2483361 RepID=A0A3M2KX78_9NOCA|nr:condensation domain-containing protein [Nocardia stercoris]RMI30099.1 acyltransferase [Nocardia stercoris]